MNNDGFEKEANMNCDPLALIQQMEVADFSQVQGIWLRGAKKAHEPRIPSDFWDSRRSTFDQEANCAEERYVYKDQTKQIGGFLLARRHGYILEVYVEESFRRRGIGTALLRTLKGENLRFPQLNGRYAALTSSVYAHNFESLAWHVKNGFTIRGVAFCAKTGLPKLEMIWTRQAAVG